jgi:DMSO reductase anchor subunit
VSRRAGAGRGEPSVVPEADFGSYYGRPVLKPPTWKTPDVPVYTFLGGMAGAAAPMAVLAELTGQPALARAGRVAALGGVTVGTVFLIHDLGRPARFLNMLRTLKPTSPLSVGSWILAGFGTLTGAAAATDLTGWLPGAGRLARYAAAVLGPVMTTYTAVLFADTAVPAWHEAHRQLPFTFAGSALGSAAGACLLATPPAQAGPARVMAVAGTAMELVAERRMDTRLGLVGEPYRRGRAGRLMRAGRALTAAGALAAAVSGRSRSLSVAAGVGLLAGSLVTRWGVFEAGRQSATDPRYTVVPQRERLAARSGVSAPSA